MTESQNAKKHNILIASGGTGGHIFPALVVAKELISNGFNVIFATDRRFHNFSEHFDDILSLNEFNLIIIDAKQPKSGVIARCMTVVNTIKNIYKSYFLIKKTKTNLIVGFGSYTFLPIAIGGFFARVKILVHEQNSFIGLGNRIASIFATKVMTSFKNTQGFYRFTLKKAVFTGMPIRSEILELHHKMENKNINYNAFYSIGNKINIFVTGGSQGASIFKKVIPEAMKFFGDDILSKITIYHQCRVNEVDELFEKYNDIGVRCKVAPFFDKPGELMTNSHIAISRSGAGSVFDLSTCGTPTIFVPLKNSANNHQYYNATEACKDGAAIIVPQDDFNAQKLYNILNKLFTKDLELLEMSKKIRNFPELKAVDNILSIIRDVLSISKENNNAKKSKPSNSNVGIS